MTSALPHSGPAEEEHLYGRPTAVELLEAARDFLAVEVMEATEGRVRFHTRVTVRVLDTVIRQLRLGPDQLRGSHERLAGLGYGSPWDLVEDIRQGRFDDRIAELAGRLEPDVRAKLEVADPRYLT